MITATNQYTNASHLFTDAPLAVLVASSQPNLRDRIVTRLESANWRVVQASGGAEALARLEQSGCHALLLDNALADLDAGEVCAIAQTRYPGLEVVIVDAVTGRVSPPDCTTGNVARQVAQLLGTEQVAAHEADENCAADDWSEPDLQPSAIDPLPGMVGNSQEMQRVYHMARLVAARKTPVLITGGTGCGKEVVARAIHALSPRASKPFITINCAAIPEALLESELFGYVRGAFTGAVQSRVGRVHAAEGGTLFLDEIGEMPISVQPKLLRFLEDGEVQRLGSSDVFQVNVRVIAATNVDLERGIQARTFRDDLYYRLSVFPIALPPLAQRSSDVPQLAEQFLRQVSPHRARFSSAALERLRRHDWPGNVRELRHVIERASILAQSNPVIGPEHIVLARRSRLS